MTTACTPKSGGSFTPGVGIRKFTDGDNGTVKVPLDEHKCHLLRQICTLTAEEVAFVLVQGHLDGAVVAIRELPDTDTGGKHGGGGRIVEV